MSDPTLPTPPNRLSQASVGAHTPLRVAREAAGVTQEGLADICHQAGVPGTDRSIRMWENEGSVPRYERTRLVICEALHVSLADLGWPEPEHDESGGDEMDPTRRQLIGGSVALVATGAEAAEYTRRSTLSGVGKAALGHLEIAVAGLAEGYFDRPPAVQLRDVFGWRRRVQQMIDGPHTLKEGPELFAYASRLSELCAWRWHELGDLANAKAWALDALTHAEEAGNNELAAWAANAWAGVSVRAHAPLEEVKAAELGITLAPAGHPVAVELRARAASGYARLGAADRCERLLAEAADLHDRLPARTPARFSGDSGAMAGDNVRGYSVTAMLQLGDDRRARRLAEDALKVGFGSPSWDASLRAKLATALARLGEVDEAVGLGWQALDTPYLPRVAIEQVRTLDAFLMRGHRDVNGVLDLHERCALAVA
jgi:hypothetical protein